MAPEGTGFSFHGQALLEVDANSRRNAIPILSKTPNQSRSSFFGDVEFPLSEIGRGVLVGEVGHTVSADTADMHAREGFVEFDLGRTAWFRIGRQVLRWGNGFAWSPTDFFGKETPSLLPRIAPQEGTDGARIQVPFGSAAMLTGFLEARSADADSLSGAVRAECSVGAAEFSVSGRAISGGTQELGLDASTGILGARLYSGILWASGDLSPHARMRGGKLSIGEDRDHSQIQATAGGWRELPIGGTGQRLRIGIEGYWNSRGNPAGLLRDDSIRGYEHPVSLLPGSLQSLGCPDSVPCRFLQADKGTAADFAVENGILVPGRWGRLYAAGLASLSKSVFDELTSYAGMLVNLQDHSGVGMLGASWNGARSLSLQASGLWSWGSRRTEFAVFGVGPTLDMLATVSF